MDRAVKWVSIGCIIYCIVRYPGRILAGIFVLYGLAQIVDWVSNWDQSSYPVSATVEHTPVRNNVFVTSEGKVTVRSPNLYALGNIPGINLTVVSTIERDYNANVVICSIVGPIHYSSQYGFSGSAFQENDTYLGIRHLMLVAYSEKYTGRFRHDNITLSPNKHSGVATGVGYMATTTSDVVTSKDKIEWCQAAERVEDLAQSLNLTVVNSVIIDRFHWLEGGGAIPSNGRYGDEAFIARTIREARSS